MNLGLFSLGKLELTLEAKKSDSRAKRVLQLREDSNLFRFDGAREKGAGANGNPRQRGSCRSARAIHMNSDADKVDGIRIDPFF